MIFVTGGIGSGKRDFAIRVLGAQEDGIAEGILDDSPVVEHAEQLVRDGESDLNALAAALSHKRIVISDEVGCGIVPIDADERAWRERAGRLSCLLAAKSDTVVRLVCGMPQVIKGRL